MTDWLWSLTRPSIRRLQAYRSARSIATEARVFLDANEAPGPVEGDLNRYPLPQPPALVARLAQVYGVTREQLLVGRGSDEAIDLLTRAFCEPGEDEILITPPTYGMYRVSAEIQNAGIVEVPLRMPDWQLDVEAMRRCVREGKIKLVYVCSPNNPTGTVFARADIAHLCAGRALVVVDEAYVEFAPETSVVPLLREFPNLVVLRTLSKAWARAGLRCGSVLAHPELIALLQKVRAPYPLAQPVIELARETLDDEATLRERVRTLTAERERLSQALADLGAVDEVFPSAANFLLVRFCHEPAVMAATARHGLLVRSRDSEPRLKNCVRLTIGNREENDQLLDALKEVNKR